MSMMYRTGAATLLCGLMLAAADNPSQKPSPFGKRKELPSSTAGDRKSTSGSADRAAATAAKTVTVAHSAETAPYTGEKVQTGLATFYAESDHGKQTSSGEAFDNEKLTAAHPNFPFGSHVRVTNLKSGKSVEVTVTDRGRFSGQRVISVSRRAAEELGFVAAGTAQVKIELLD